MVNDILSSYDAGRHFRQQQEVDVMILLLPINLIIIIKNYSI